MGFQRDFCLKNHRQNRFGHSDKDPCQSCQYKQDVPGESSIEATKQDHQFGWKNSERREAGNG